MSEIRKLAASNQGGQVSGGTEPVAEVELQIRERPAKGVAVVDLRQGENVLHSDKIKIDQSEDRKQFIDRCIEVAPALEGVRDEFEQKLQGLAAKPASRPRGGPDKADRALRLAMDCCSVFCSDDPDRTPFADLDVNGHRESWPIDSQRFRDVICGLFYESEQKGLSDSATRNVVSTLVAKARKISGHRSVYVRVANLDDRVYIDLCDDAWRVVEIDSDGVRILNAAPDAIRFRRTGSMLPLPEPILDESVDVAELREFLHCRDEQDFVLAVAWLVAALMGRKSLPIAVLQGEQGSGKSTFSKMLRSLVDPNSVDLRSAPKNEEDLMVAARNCWVLGFDNLSNVPSWLSDAFCRISSGAGFGTRKLYTNSEESLFSGVRPVLLNGIPDLVSRPDLGSRSILLRLPRIEADKRSTERELWPRFDEARPRIFGALLLGVSGSLARRSEVELPSLPRMADFAELATAAEPALGWAEGTFLKAYNRSEREWTESILENDAVAEAVRLLLKHRERCPLGEWVGTATELLKAFEKLGLSDAMMRSPVWPKSPQAVGSQIRRLQPVLREVGIEIERTRAGSRRGIRIRQKNFQPDDCHRATQNIGYL